MQNVILDSTKKLQIQLDALKATNECDVTVSYADTNGNILVGDGAQESRSNGVTLQDILAAPVNPNIRNALTITVVNNDTIQHTVYIYKVTGAGNYLVTEQILAVGASWDSNLNNNIMTPAGGNGVISVTVSSNNLTLALKTSAGADPSTGSPVTAYIDGVLHTITSALSVTVSAGAAGGSGTFNAGSLEFKTQAIDYAAYLGYNTSAAAVVIAASRIYHANAYSDFSAVANNDKYAAISNISGIASTDPFVPIGRFEATNSGSASYNWSVPTYTAINLKQRAMFQSRLLTWVPQFTNLNVGSTGTITASYQIVNQTMSYSCVPVLGGTGISVGDVSHTLPMSINASLSPTGSITGFLKLECQTNGHFQGNPAIGSSTSVSYRCLDLVGGTYVGQVPLGASAPATWAAGNSMIENSSYGI